MMRALKCVASSFPTFCSQRLLIGRGRIGIVRVTNAKLSESNAKRANLCARKKERIRLPNYGGADGGKRDSHISEFLNHPSGVDSILNTRALQSVQFLDSNMYRCVLPQIQLLNFEVAPVLDLQVTPTTDYCVVEMLSCKYQLIVNWSASGGLLIVGVYTVYEEKSYNEFEGSEPVERQNDHFSASMVNHITWETIDSQSFLNVDVTVNLILEIYTRPFTLLPTSAVERPGNLMMQALIDRLVPLHVQQLLQDYDNWVRRQRKYFQ